MLCLSIVVRVSEQPFFACQVLIEDPEAGIVAEAGFSEKNRETAEFA